MNPLAKAEARQAATAPRCNFTNFTNVTTEPKYGLRHYGAPCGGRLVVKKRSGVTTSVECRRCGRSESVEAIVAQEAA